jgi:hypothetical protein
MRYVVELLGQFHQNRGEVRHLSLTLKHLLLLQKKHLLHCCTVVIARCIGKLLLQPVALLPELKELLLAVYYSLLIEVHVWNAGSCRKQRLKCYIVALDEWTTICNLVNAKPTPASITQHRQRPRRRSYSISSTW